MYKLKNKQLIHLTKGKYHDGGGLYIRITRQGKGLWTYRYGNIIGVVISQLNKFKLAKSIGSLPENVNFGIKASTVRQFLNTSGVITNYSKRIKPVSNEKMFELASKQTVMVVCHR